MTDEELKQHTLNLFGYLSNFEHDWAEGYRPMFHRWVSAGSWSEMRSLGEHVDILFASELGSYIRQGDDDIRNNSPKRVSFQLLLAELLARGEDYSKRFPD
jgi:hypothetical protein